MALPVELAGPYLLALIENEMLTFPPLFRFRHSSFINGFVGYPAVAQVTVNPAIAWACRAST